MVTASPTRTLVENEVVAQIRTHAYLRLNASERRTTNLHLDHRIYAAGDHIGPAFQKIVASKDSILVFADDHPMANFGHDCRYMLYDPHTAEPHETLPARFPPIPVGPETTLKVFHEPVRFAPVGEIFRFYRFWRCPVVRPIGNRYAILYSGMSNMRHLNDMEFCYRTLIDRYGFDPHNIYVLNYDGTLHVQEGAATIWPGDNTAYRIHVTGTGDRAGFQGAINTIRPKIKPDDLLFIHTNNHGDNFGDGSFLCTYPSYGIYKAADFCADLATLPHYKSLLVMMEQCNSGGFNAPVIAASTAASTSIASAAIATQSSWASPDGHWDSFARDWIAAQAGHDPYGAALAHNADSNNDGSIEAIEAFNYANSIKNPNDTPNYSHSAAAADGITLSQQYVLYWLWCLLVWQIIEPYYPVPQLPWPPIPGPDPGPDFHAAVAALAPQLQHAVLPALDRAFVDLRRQLAPQVEQAVKAEFAKRNIAARI